jgi:hypothetical protein
VWLTTFLKRKFLAFGSQKSGDGKRELHALLKDIDRKGPLWYRPWTNRITSSFAEAVVALRGALAPLGATLRATVAGDKEAERKSVDALFGKALAVAGLRSDSFAFEVIKREAERRSGELRSSMDELFNLRIAAFKSKTIQRYELGFGELSRLAALWEYDFDGLLAIFAKNGAYVSCDAELAESALADLHFLINGLEIRRETVEVYGILRGHLKDALGPAHDPAAELVAVASVLAKELRPERVGAVLRATLGDATLEFKAYGVAGKIFETRFKAICDDYASKCALLDESIRAAELEARKREVFGDRELVAIPGYSEEMHALFRNNKLPPLSFVAPLSIVASFLSFFFLPYVRGAASGLIVDLDFLDEDYHRGFVASLDKCAKLVSDLESLEDLLSSPGPASLMPIMESLKRDSLDATKRRIAEDRIEKTEHSCEGIVHEAFSSFTDLLAFLDKLLLDLKSKKPELVANASFINRNKAKTLTEIELCARLLTACLKLLRLFFFDRSDIEKAIGKANGKANGKA